MFLVFGSLMPDAQENSMMETLNKPIVESRPNASGAHRGALGSPFLRWASDIYRDDKQDVSALATPAMLRKAMALSLSKAILKTENSKTSICLRRVRQNKTSNAIPSSDRLRLPEIAGDKVSTNCQYYSNKGFCSAPKLPPLLANACSNNP
jgi:hypothetical protein